MQIFLDTAKIDEIREAVEMGLISGVTTNPSLMMKAGRSDYMNAVREICYLVQGHISAEVVSTDAQGMLAEAREIATWSPYVAVKIPSTPTGLRAIRQISEEDVDLERLALAIEQLCTNERPMRRRVLEELVRRDEPTTLFDLCDALDAQGGKGETVFEPAVERTLRDLRPLLRVEGSGDARTWRPFSPALARAVGPGPSR